VRFVFRLQTLLNWKRTLEELSQMRLSQKTKRLRDHEEDIQRVIDLRISTGQRLQNMIQEPITASEFLIYKGYEEACYGEIRSKEEEKEHLVGEIESEKKELVAFMREKKVLERLEKKGAKRFDLQMEKMDQKEIDEEAVMRRGRK
jgi:flagellar export protein FliJ